jgi:hypothetical protein
VLAFGTIPLALAEDSMGRARLLWPLRVSAAPRGSKPTARWSQRADAQTCLAFLEVSSGDAWASGARRRDMWFCLPGFRAAGRPVVVDYLRPIGPPAGGCPTLGLALTAAYSYRP